MRKKAFRLITLIILVLILTMTFVACGDLRLQYKSLSETMSKLGYKYFEESAVNAPFSDSLDEKIQGQIETVVFYYGSSLPEKAGNEAFIYYCKTSHAADTIEKRLKADYTLPSHKVYRSGRIVVYGTNGAIEDVRGY